MCLRCCQFCTWELTCTFLGIICLAISFIFGPLHTILYLAGERPELDNHWKNEPKYAFFLLSIIVLMWMVFLSSVLLLCGLCSRSLCCINCYLFWIILHVVLGFVLCVTYLVDCVFFDQKCMDHSKTRKGTDVGAAVGVMILNLVYTFVWVLIIFAVCNYKLIAD